MFGAYSDARNPDRVLKLIIEDDEGRKTVVPFVRDEITIGRQEGNTIRLTERNVSRRHARLMRHSGNVLIEDLGSYNGIRINGDRIAGQVQVSDGDLIQIGDYDLALQAEEMAATVPLDTTTPRSLAPTGKLPDPSATIPGLPTVEMPQVGDDEVQDAVGSDDPPEIPRHQSTAVIRVDQLEGSRKRQVAQISAADAPRLVVLNTDFAGREFPCTRTELKIGRTDDNDVALDHRSLSRTHCKVVREDNGEWRVIDLQSANGLMVNGEPYAQVTLRYGDVIELGHVKIQFVGPGEAAAAPISSTPSSITQESEPTPSSKAPIIAIAGAVVVVIVGIGGYALWKSKSPVDPPHRDPIANNKPPVVVPDPRDTRPPDPVKPDPELARKAIAEKIAKAKESIEVLEFGVADELLRECVLDGAIAPEAQRLLSDMEGEKAFKKALDDAGRLLDEGNDEKASPLLAAAKQTKLLTTKLKELTERRDKLSAERLKKAAPVAVLPKQPEPTPKTSKTEEAEALYNEANDLKKSQNLDAAVIRLERCIKVAPSYFNCYKMLGSVYAKISTRDSSAADMEKARRNYERFIELAPPDDQAVQRVRDILDGK